jgi:hypothetical protein
MIVKRIGSGALRQRDLEESRLRLYRFSDCSTLKAPRSGMESSALLPSPLFIVQVHTSGYA